ncbi:MAG: hypothetical protein ACNI3C_08865 [Candidatus Marinarcus sp.]|uniref:hypothetical protein n=1 Tax=Candidatus Marinarcus sp. TaxID=3100987 RepID=UPI003B0070F6
MINKTQLILALLGIVIALCAWLFPVQNIKKTENFNNTVTSKIKTANLKILGSNVKVKVKKGKYFYTGGELNSANSESIVYINEKQQLVIDIAGAYVDIYIDELIRENVVINNYGTNLKIKKI